jgi:catechol 2,3-dioxygenase-like lactoylglutathione lyase family enzyme
MTEILDRPTAQTERRSPVKVKKLGHVVYTVSDIERSTKFYTEILNFRVSDVNERGMVFLTTCGDHHTIALASAEDGANARQPEKGGLRLSHFAMEVETLEELFEIRAYLKEKGVPIIFEGRKGAGGNTGVEFHDPDGYTIELYWKMDQMPGDHPSRPSAQWNRVSSLEDARDQPLPETW